MKRKSIYSVTAVACTIAMGITSVGVLLTVGSCSFNSSNEGMVVRVDINSPEEVSLSDFVERVELIQLENRPEAMIPGGNYAISDDAFYFLNYQDLSINAFDADGNWTGSAHKAGRGPGEYTMADDIIFCPEDSTVRVLNPMGLVYRYSIPKGFEFLDMTQVHGQLRAVHNFWPVGKGDYLLFSGTEENDRVFIYSGKNSSVRTLNSSHPHWVESSPFSRTTYPFYEFHGTIRYYSGLDGAIYSYNPGTQTLDPYLRWDFGKNQFRISDISQEDMESNDNKKIAAIARDVRDTKVAPVHGICETDRFIIADAYYKMDNYSVIFEKETRTVSLFKETTEGIFFLPEKARNDCCYRCVSPEKLDHFISPAILTDEHSRKIFSEAKDDSNLIIIKYHMK